MPRLALRKGPFLKAPKLRLSDSMTIRMLIRESTPTEALPQSMHRTKVSRVCSIAQMQTFVESRREAQVWRQSLTPSQGSISLVLKKKRSIHLPRKVRRREVERLLLLELRPRHQPLPAICKKSLPSSLMVLRWMERLLQRCARIVRFSTRNAPTRTLI